MEKLSASRGALAAALFLAAAIVISGCGTAHRAKDLPGRDGPPKAQSYKIKGKWYHPIKDSSGFRESGLGSWYGDPFHGRKTASGETYNMHAKTAAHKILPMNTIVLVRNTDNGKETVVRINDRGPFVRGRVIDLSYRAAREIGMVGPGTANVEVIAMEKDQDMDGDKELLSNAFTVQVGAFESRTSAENLKRKLGKTYDQVFITTVKQDSRTFYRVRVGRFASLETAKTAETRLVENGHENAFTVASDDG